MSLSWHGFVDELPMLSTHQGPVEAPKTKNRSGCVSFRSSAVIPALFAGMTVGAADGAQRLTNCAYRPLTDWRSD